MAPRSILLTGSPRNTVLVKAKDVDDFEVISHLFRDFTSWNPRSPLLSDYLIEFRFNSELIHRMHQADHVVSQHLEKHLVHLSDLRTRTDEVSELPFHRTERRLRI